MQCAHQEVARSAGPITGEHAARAVGAVSRGRKAENQHPRERIAEPGYRASPVRVRPKGGALLYGDALAVVTQAAAAFAGHDLLLGECKGGEDA